MGEDSSATGFAVLNSARLNKSTAFSKEERERLKLRGLLPAAVCSQAVQIDRVLANVRRKENDLERYILLRGLQARNERLFYRVLLDHIDEIMPLVYTPTVGEACKQFAHIFRQSVGFYLSPEDRGEMRAVIDNWPADDVKVVVATDGERILGLGDLGANGMGISIGKLALYTACAGIAPQQCMPVMLDVGTNNVALRDDPLYLGTNAPRLQGAEYDAFIDEFVRAVQDRYPNCLIQFEDFVTPNAYKLLGRYRDQMLCFNDDIQGTAVVALAGLMASTRVTGVDLKDMRFVFLGAGSANVGIASLLLGALREDGLDERAALERIWLVDVEGLITAGRDEIAPHAAPFAKAHAPLGFLETLAAAEPHALIGATGSPGSISKEAIQIMSRASRRPVIFALSNPTASAECTAAQAYEWSDGQAVFASGSPFGPVVRNGIEHRPGQGNNVYAFPGIGRAAVVAKARRLPDSVFLAAARALAACVEPESLAAGTLYPSLSRIRDVTLDVAMAAARKLLEEGLAQTHKAADLDALIRADWYDMTY